MESLRRELMSRAAARPAPAIESSLLLLSLDTGFANDRAPLVHLGLQIGRKRFRRLLLGRRNLQALVSDTLTHRRIRHRRLERRVELRHRLLRRALRRIGTE